MDGATELIHGTAIAVAGRAMVFRGPPGSGKSDLALRCITQPSSPLVPQPAVLVSDDQIVLRRNGPTLRVSAPASIYGRIEVRGVGIVAVPSQVCADAELALIIELGPVEAVERHPDPVPTVELLGVQVPCLKLAPFEPSAAAKALILLNRIANHSLRLD